MLDVHTPYWGVPLYWYSHLHLYLEQRKILSNNPDTRRSACKERIQYSPYIVFYLFSCAQKLDKVHISSERPEAAVSSGGLVQQVVVSTQRRVAVALERQGLFCHSE